MDGRHKYIQWLVAEWDKQPRRPLPDLQDDPLASMDDCSERTMPGPDPERHGHFVLGSSCGWLTIADERGQIYLINPATGGQHALPRMETMGVFLPCRRDGVFCVNIYSFLTARFGSGPPFKDHHWGPHGKATMTLAADQMRSSFYRKVVLSASPGPGPGSCTAMLILHRDFGAPAFATAEDPAWRLAPSRDGVEDAIHHNGRFYSVSYAGDVEAWERDGESGAFTSTAVAPRLIVQDEEGGSSSCRKYLAAAPGGQLMAVLKYLDKRVCYVLLEEDDGQWQWKETSDIAVFAGVNNVHNDKALAQYKHRGYAYVEVDIGYADDQPYLKEDMISTSIESNDPTMSAPDPSHIVLGSSCGWLASADKRGQMYLVNAATGEQHALPHIATIGVILQHAGDCSFCFKIDDLLAARFGHGPPFSDHCWGPAGAGGSLTLAAHQMRSSFYRKVVLSASPSPDNYTAMLIPHQIFGAPAFATAEDPAWRLVPSRAGVEDAIHHDGKFYSVSYSGVVETWERDAESGAFVSTAVEPRLTVEGSSSSCCKYLKVASGGRLMVVLNYPYTFKAHLLDVDGQWKETRDFEFDEHE